ncbi:dihydroneopterin triphosphate diphosphatase [Solemya pervernicosa gill symbiont]|uniref:Dihydroneopterin triphosphate diphosphatase n=2 Tax=Gammaproteobacteria incertae sedis TaxID=118884 RepID=A0A1T2L434_9GAMM|nr:dihydroneopterin triphosphate diphosphatase [Candidatus Reidiella endopervernicosa]OOZ39832.1 dihydroneopterin triphosphate diphosphatase [Solemya pervernicosa gill symbiont]QKQ27476.1 dihydroneopterin triphosphate diphosphatase [Candidatus Reidiella endopervernicosa]
MADFKRPESVLVVVSTRQGEVLLLERTHPEGFWQSVTGSLEAGESPAEAAQRELAEETGIKDVEVVDCQQRRCFPILPEWRSRYAPDVSENCEHLFTVQLDQRCAIKLNNDEHCRYLWVDRAEAAGRVSSYTNRDAVLAIVSK